MKGPIGLLLITLGGVIAYLVLTGKLPSPETTTDNQSKIGEPTPSPTPSPTSIVPLNATQTFVGAL